MSSSLSIVNPHAGGIDLGAEKIFISAIDDEVVNFGTFTSEYLRAIEYLQSHFCTSVAMEATGVYWLVFFDMLEKAGIKVCLFNGRLARNLPGRKSDVVDCQWFRQLHTFGLLHSCFIPEEAIRQLRTYTRLRSDHLSMASTHILHMQKALDLMNLKLHNVISQIHGVSGLRIIRAILAGERSPERLAELCEKSILKHKRDLVIASLEGHYKDEHLFALGQALAAWEFYQGQIASCDQQIELLLERLCADKPEPPSLGPAKPIRHNAPKITDLHRKLVTLTDGKDLSTITGLTDKTVMEAIAETGVNLADHWKSVEEFTNWLGLAPAMHQSGKSTKRVWVKKNSIAGQIFREAAMAIANSKYSALSGFYRRIKARKGFKVAIKATARKIAVLYYNLLTKGQAYVEYGLEQYQQRFLRQQRFALEKKAKTLGLRLIPE